MCAYECGACLVFRNITLDSQQPVLHGVQGTAQEPPEACPGSRVEGPTPERPEVCLGSGKRAPLRSSMKVLSLLYPDLEPLTFACSL